MNFLIIDGQGGRPVKEITERFHLKGAMKVSLSLKGSW